MLVQSVSEPNRRPYASGLHDSMVRQHGGQPGAEFAKDVLGNDGAVKVEAVARQGHALLGRVPVRHGRRLHVLFGKARGADVRGWAPLVGHVVVPRHGVEGRSLDPVAAHAGPPTQGRHRPFPSAPVTGRRTSQWLRSAARLSRRSACTLGWPKTKIRVPRSRPEGPFFLPLQEKKQRRGNRRHTEK